MTSIASPPAPGNTASPASTQPPAQNAAAPHSVFGGRFGENPYFAAGFGLMGIGVVLTALRKGAQLSSVALRKRLIVSLEIPNNDRAYEWVLAWLAEQRPPGSVNARLGAPGKEATNVRGARDGWGGRWVRWWLRSNEMSVETRVSGLGASGGDVRVDFGLVVGPGVHWVKYRGAWMQIKRERQGKIVNTTTGKPWETLTLSLLSRDRTRLPILLSEARDLALQGQEGKMVIYTAWGAEWRPFGMPRARRPLGSVVLAEGVAEKVAGDVSRFLERRKWYGERGIPYRRGYLLHGPPGSGKSSFIQALAASLSYDICLLNLGQRGLADDKLNLLLSNAPARSVVLMEDIDAAFNKRAKTSEDGYQSSLTFSGFLNALDGVVSAEERLLFMTTNHISHLDPALIRPGRVDVVQCLDDAEPGQARRLFERFYGAVGVVDGGEVGVDASGKEQAKDDAREIRELAGRLEELVRRKMATGERMSMASLQGHFIVCENAQVAVERAEELFVRRG